MLLLGSWGLLENKALRRPVWHLLTSCVQLHLFSSDELGCSNWTNSVVVTGDIEVLESVQKVLYTALGYLSSAWPPSFHIPARTDSSRVSLRQILHISEAQLRDVKLVSGEPMIIIGVSLTSDSLCTLFLQSPDWVRKLTLLGRGQSGRQHSDLRRSVPI